MASSGFGSLNMTSSLVSADELARELSGLLPSGQVTTGESIRALHGEDLSFHPRCLPDIVIFPNSVAEVVRVMELADARRVPVVPFGAGSSLEGHILPVAGGISLDMTRLDSVVAVRQSELTATVEAGVRRLALERVLAEHGLFFPVDPGADATLGGMAATNAAGTMTFAYGKMRSQVLSLQAVLPGGRMIRVGSRATKTSAGYDLTGLLVGSEGTLGVITELTVRLAPIPERVLGVHASFASVGDAAAAAQDLVALGAGVRRIELIDEWEIVALNRFRAMNAGGAEVLRELPLLLVEAAGAPEAADAAVAEVVEVLGARGALDLIRASTPPECAALWTLRREVFEAERQVAPGRRSVSTDACVPLSQLGDAVEFTRDAINRWGLLGGIVCHAGDGNIHTGLLVDPDDAHEMRRLNAYLDDLAGDALARGGTCTGEHGIGMGKRDALAREHGDQLDLMRSIKRSFDPNGIMNPGKVLPDEACAEVAPLPPASGHR
jgi:D-lactate dehydrogenase (cytochrome)